MSSTTVSTVKKMPRFWWKINLDRPTIKNALNHIGEMSLIVKKIRTEDVFLSVLFRSGQCLLFSFSVMPPSALCQRAGHVVDICPGFLSRQVQKAEPLKIPAGWIAVHLPRSTQRAAWPGSWYAANCESSAKPLQCD